MAQTSREPVETAEALLLAVRRGEDPTDHERALAALDPATLDRALASEPARRAFWLNVYNGFAQVLLERDPGRYDSRRRFFGAELFTVAGEELSLDDVEHDLLRGGRWKLGLGYVPNPFVGAFADRFGVPVDPRIHFALNCGATSCPPVAVYTPDGLDAQLDLATASYLETEARYDPDRNVVTVPRLCLWFRGDFGGTDGILALLREHGVVPPDARPRLTHADYDWTLDVGNYRE